jgi:hexulose-6-phosphate isomerase
MIDTNCTRRGFLKTGGVALAAALVAPAGAEESTAPAPRRSIKKGIMWGSVSSQASIRDRFKMIKDAGFAGTEIDSGLNRAEVLAARDASGLEIPSVVCATHWVLPLSDPNPKVRQEGLAGLRTALHDAHEYGSSSVLFVPAVVNQQATYDQAYIRSQADIRQVLALAHDLNVKIAIENVWNNFLLSPLEAARYIDEFRSPVMAWHFDVGNIIATGWPEQWIHILGKRIHKLHIKEYSRKKRDEEGLWKGFQVEYMQGDNDWPVVMRALDAVNYNGWGTAEPAYRPPNVDEPTRLAQVSGYLDKIFAS